MEILKQDLIGRIAMATDTPPTRTQKIVDALIDIIIAEAAAGNRVKVFPLGSFHTKERKERTWTHPRTKEVMQLKAHRGIHFSPSKKFRKAVK